MGASTRASLNNIGEVNDAPSIEWGNAATTDRIAQTIMYQDESNISYTIIIKSDIKLGSVQ